MTPRRIWTLYAVLSVISHMSSRCNHGSKTRCVVYHDTKFQWRYVAEKFGFVEYSSSLLSHADLYRRPTLSSAEGLDQPIYSKELYKFNDRKGRNIAIRPDTTPQFMHMLKRVRGNEYPAVSPWLWPKNIVKWYTIADCWRYERPGLGRRRNHIQCSFDIVGVEGIEAEVDILKALIFMLQEMGLTSRDVVIRLNHRKLIDKILNGLELSVEVGAHIKGPFLRLVDKRQRITAEEFLDKMQQLLGNAAAQKFVRIVDACTNCSIAREMMGYDDSLNDLEKVIKAVGKEWCQLDLSLVRGNDYYTGIIFEVYEKNALNSRAVAGGGRYDGYFGSTGLPQLDYAVGFGIGNIQISRLIKPKLQSQLYPKIDVVALVDGASNTEDKRFDIMLQKLRKAGKNIYEVLGQWKMSKVIQFAVQSNARLLLQLDPQNKDCFLVAQPPEWEPKSLTASQLLQF